MKNFKKVLAMLVIMMSAVSCQKEEASPVIQEYSREVTTEEVTEPVTEEEKRVVDVSGQTITWLADYSLTPEEGGSRSVALALFQDVYGADINFVVTTKNDRFTKLSEMINGGEEVDMFPYDESEIPNGVINGQFQELDPYFDVMGIDDEESDLWDGMRETIENLSYNGNHYVIPYDISNPSVLIYNRNVIKQEELEDPYELYKKGEWDWNKMMEIMRKFVDNHTGITKYGITGDVGKPLIQSTGTGVVTYENGKFINNLNSPKIKAAGEFMQQLHDMNLVSTSYIDHFPMDDSTLFFSGGWALGASNALNPESDLMVVPFPKSPDGDRYYMSCDLNARMLVKNSTKGEAVAAYIKCERIAATEKAYDEQKKAAALVERKVNGKTKSVVKGEQYDAVHDYVNSADTVPAFDFAYGLGKKMNNQDSHYYSSKGVMNNIEDAVIKGYATSWENFCGDWSPVIDEAVKEFNK